MCQFLRAAGRDQREGLQDDWTFPPQSLSKFGELLVDRKSHMM